MHKKYNPKGKFSDLRQLADELMHSKSENEYRLPGELGDMFHELQTHQIELELQNEELKQTQQDLLQSQKTLSDLYDFAPVGYLSISDKGLILRANLKAASLLGVERGRLIKQPLSLFIDLRDQDTYFLTRKKLLESKQQQIVELRLRHINKETVFIQISCTIDPEVDGNEGQFRLALINITDKVNDIDKINTLSQAIEQSPVSVIITDTDAKVEYVNQTFEQITGYHLKEIMGQKIDFLQSGKTPLKQYENLWTTLRRGKAWQGEFLNKKKNGETFWEYAHIAPVFAKTGEITHYLAVKEDITQRKQQQDYILYQAHFDKLTDLPNRLLALDRFSQLIHEAKRNNKLVAIFFLDLDDFKKVNDSMGHEVGDELLVQAASRLKKVIRSGDTVARWGGDEFIILLGDVDKKEDVHSVAKNVLSQFRESFNVNQRDLLTTVSIGIAFFPYDGDDVQVLLRHADSAMYYAKNQGANTYAFFDQKMNTEVSKRLLIEEQMREALKRGEFEIYYQAKVDINNQQLIGAEALLRWHNEVLGPISPEEFIPIAEQTGLIIPIGQFVLKQALIVLAKWQKEYDPDFQMAVNLSPRQFRDPQLVNFIKQTLADTMVKKHSLELEITEGVLMSDYKQVNEQLSTIRALGVSIAMDDFGTGYSSLNYLRNHHFDILKIDRSFINDIHRVSVDRELVSAAIAMGHSLGLKIVAEGVETQEQLTYLQQLNCDYGQGYFYNKPLPEQDMIKWMQSRKTQ